VVGRCPLAWVVASRVNNAPWRLAPSTAHNRGANGAAQRSNRSRCRRSANADTSPTSCSSRSITAAICDPLWGIDPNHEQDTLLDQRWNTAADTPDAGMPFLFRATPQGSAGGQTHRSKANQKWQGIRETTRQHPRRYETAAARDTNPTIRALCVALGW
jgi:hypothetical protein